MAFCAGVSDLGDKGCMGKGRGSLCRFQVIIEVKIILAEVGLPILVVVVFFRKILKLNNISPFLEVSMQEPAFVGSRLYGVHIVLHIIPCRNFHHPAFSWLIQYVHLLDGRLRQSIFLPQWTISVLMMLSFELYEGN
jgi:hypothetical protein